VTSIATGGGCRGACAPIRAPGSPRIEIAAGAAPASILAAAHAAHPEGTLEAVEIVEGPETLGGLEYRVKKRVAGESVRIRVTEAGQVEVLRKARTELRIPK
jgi:hypothetical protein